MSAREDVFIFGGGLRDDPYLLTPPGSLHGSKNFESGLTGGYARILGYERFDGRSKPHLQTYTAFTVSDASALSLGSITGATSGATGEIIGIDTDSNTIGVTKIVGTFVASEVISGSVTISAVLGEGLGPDALDATWLLAAQDEYRGDITVVPGSGNILGVYQHEDVVYAFRANVGGTAVGMYKSTAAGWVQVTLPNILLFDTGSGAAIAVGDTVTGATSGASATVLKVVTYSGAWGVDAAGYLVLDTITSGPYQNNENLQVSASTRAQANGASYAHTLSTGGRFEFLSHNFYATSSTYNMYGCDGVNPAFEFDGTTFSPILIPSIANAPASNVPKFIAAHKHHLFLGYPGGVFQHSVQGEPLVFSGFLGAAEFGVGDEITGMVSEAGEVLVIKTLRQTYGLYGEETSTWQLKLVAPDTGGVAYTVQEIGSTISVDDRGVVILPRTEQFGDFEAATISRAFQSAVDYIKSRVAGSVVVRNKNQYRLFATDNSFLLIYFKEDGTVEGMLCEYDHRVTCISNSSDSSGNELIFFGSTNGYVYQAEVGNNFDGEAIESFVQLPFSFQSQPEQAGQVGRFGTPNTRKRFRRAFVDLRATSPVTLTIGAEIDYGDPKILTPLGGTASVTTGTGGFWDISNWDEFYWDSQIVNELRFDLTGTGPNIALTFYNNSAVVSPFSLHSARIVYEPRRKSR